MNWKTKWAIEMWVSRFIVLVGACCIIFTAYVLFFQKDPVPCPKCECVEATKLKLTEDEKKLKAWSERHDKERKSGT